VHCDAAVAAATAYREAEPGQWRSHHLLAQALFELGTANENLEDFVAASSAYQNSFTATEVWGEQLPDAKSMGGLCTSLREIAFKLAASHSIGATARVGNLSGNRG